MAVTNDLVTDRRVDKMARSLLKMGFRVELIGRKLPGSLEISDRPYGIRRFRLPFTKGAAFYACYNLRLFCYLLFRKTRVLVANDLDTLAAVYLVHKIRRIPIVYDSHEYFTGVPELQHRPFVKAVWKRIERWILPRLSRVITVNDSIAGLYQEEYGIRPAVVRNMPVRQEHNPQSDRKALHLPEDQRILILQGAGINIQRGAEEAVLSMRYLDNCILLIVGDGDVLPALRMLVTAHQLESRVRFVPKQPMDVLRRYTVCADIGLTLDKNTNINYRFSLPNKLFDYIHAGLPVFASDLPEISAIIRSYDIGMVCPEHDPQVMASLLKDMLSDPVRIEKWKENLKLAARELCWENEEQVIVEYYADFL